MKILHYALGFPPYRTGGLTKYCLDLMKGQEEQSHRVALLWPGQMGFLNHRLSIRKRKDNNGIQNFEIFNPLPVALDEGIKNVSAYMNVCKRQTYVEFLLQYNPDAIHLHTLMGIHKEFLEAAKELKIKIVYTTHDFYGICSKGNLFRKGHVCVNDNGCNSCVACNQGALSLKKITLMQNPVYRKLKNTKMIEMLRRRHRDRFYKRSLVGAKRIALSDYEVDEKAKDYLELRNYYLNMLSLVDTIHFNSSISKMVYSRYLKPVDSRIIPITHADIADNRKKKNFDQRLRITYLASISPGKGFDILKDALDELWEKRQRKFELNIFSPIDKTSPYIKTHDRYQYSELENIFNNTDLLVVPSIWYETFGFTALEALSFGVPVLVSMNVGAKDCMKDGKFGWIVEGDKENLKTQILKISRNDLKNMNEVITKEFEVPEFRKHVKETIMLYS